MNWDTTWICTCGDFYAGDGIMELIPMAPTDVQLPPCFRPKEPTSNECHRWDCGWAREWGHWRE